MNLELTDLDALKEAAIAKFDDKVEESDREGSLDQEVARLLGELEQIYRVVVLLQKENRPWKPPQCCGARWLRYAMDSVVGFRGSLKSSLNIGSLTIAS